MSGAILHSTIRLHGLQKNKYYFYIISFYFCSDYQFFKKTNKYYSYIIIIYYQINIRHLRLRPYNKTCLWIYNAAAVLCLQYSTVQYSTVQYSTVQYSTVHGRRDFFPIIIINIIIIIITVVITTITIIVIYEHDT
jgi:hypothetical protein